MGPRDISPVLSKLIAIVVLFVIIFFVGTFTESRIGGDRLKAGLDAAMAQIPGVRSICNPLDQISTMLLDGDTGISRTSSSWSSRKRDRIRLRSRHQTLRR